MPSGIGSGGFHEIELYVGQSRLSTKDDIFKFIFMNENCYTSIGFSLKIVSNAPINNKRALVQLMTWCWTGKKAVFEPMMDQFNDAYMQRSASMS